MNEDQFRLAPLAYSWSLSCVALLTAQGWTVYLAMASAALSVIYTILKIVRVALSIRDNIRRKKEFLG